MNISLLNNSQLSSSITINTYSLDIALINNFTKTITVNTNTVSNSYLLIDPKLYINDSPKPVVTIVQ